MELKPIGLFEGMSDNDLKKLTKQMREVRHQQGAEIILHGKDGVGFLVILEGEAEVTTGDGRHRKLGPGDHFGEMALLDQQGRSADITARTDLVLGGRPRVGFQGVPRRPSRDHLPAAPDAEPAPARGGGSPEVARLGILEVALARVVSPNAHRPR